MIRVLFVCLGNICRSPMAEGVFKELIKKNSLDSIIQCDSAGTAGYHIGEPPDKRMRETALKHGIKLVHSGQQLNIQHFNEFEYILAMDRSNFRNIQNLKKGQKGTISQEYMMRNFDSRGKGRDVPDPYYGVQDGFEEVFQICKRSCVGLLEHIKKENNL